MSRRLLTVATLLAMAIAAVVTTPAYADRRTAVGGPEGVRFATYNASMNRSGAGDLLADLMSGTNPQIAKVAAIIQRVRPDVLLINEFDFDPTGQALDAFREHYLSESQQGSPGISYPYAFAAPSNTGIPSGFDLNNSGDVGGPDDAYGFGFFPGQFGMAVFSRFPIDHDDIRTFQTFLWADMPGALLPDDLTTSEPADFYSAEELQVFRLSSKSHWDVPIEIGRRTVHFLVSHPTPPVFDGPEDRNGRRNHDEIRFWADYVHPAKGEYIYDDEGRSGGLQPGARFVIAGDQNADPFDGDSVAGAAQQLLTAPLINDRVIPSSEGGPEAAALQGQANEAHEGNPAYDTADFGDEPPFGSGNLRVDYVLPSRGLPVLDAGVFWPPIGSTGADPGGGDGRELIDASDHRAVWIDVHVPGSGYRSSRT